MREGNRRNGLVSMQEMQMAGHGGLVHLRGEDRRARIPQLVRICPMALDMAVGVGVARDSRVTCEAYPYALL